MGRDLFDELGDQLSSTLIVLGVVQMVGAIGSKCMQRLASQLFDQCVGEVQSRPLEFRKQLPEDLQQTDALELAHPMPIDDGRLEDPTAQTRWALLLRSLKRDGTVQHLVLTHQDELKAQID